MIVGEQLCYINLLIGFHFKDLIIRAFGDPDSLPKEKTNRFHPKQYQLV